MAYVSPPAPNTQITPGLRQGSIPGTSGRGLGTSAPVTHTLGWHTNGTVNYAYVCRRLKNDVDHSMRAGQLVFIRKDAPPIGSRLYTLLNLPMINVYLRRLYEKMVQQGGQVPTLETVDTQWAPLGFIQGERGQDTGNSAQERLINVTIQGRAFVSNHWCVQNERSTRVKRVKDGMKLYMELYEVAGVPDVPYREDLDRWTSDAVEDWTANRTNDGRQLGGGPPRRRVKPTSAKQEPPLVQFRPYVCGGNSLGVPVKAGSRFYYVGMVSHAPHMTGLRSKRHYKQAETDIFKLATLQQIEVFVGYLN